MRKAVRPLYYIVYMFRIYIRLSLIALSAGLGTFLLFREDLRAALPLYLGSFILLLSYLLFGNIWSAYRALNRGDTQLAEKQLNWVINPQFLLPRPRAYYYFIRGMIALQRNRLREGRQTIWQALDIGLQKENDCALARLNLAHIAYLQQDYVQCRQEMNQLNNLAFNDLMIRDKLSELEETLRIQQSN